MSDFVILPAIDLKDGQCVRLRQGRADDVKVYGHDPAAQAADWARQARNGCMWWIWMARFRDGRCMAR